MACDTEGTVSEDLNVTHEDITSGPEQIHAESSQPVVKNVSKRKGIFRAIGELKKLQEVINREVPVPTDKEDRFDVFGKSVAMQLRALSFERGMIGQARIQNILTELSIENYKYNNMSVSNETSTSSDRSAPGFNILYSGSEGTDTPSPAMAVSTETLTSPEYSGDNFLSQAIVMTFENDATVLSDETQ